MLRLGTWNVQGISNKWDSFVGVVESHGADIVGVCEHWMKEGDSHKLGPNSRYVWFGKVDKESEGKNRGVAGVGFLVDSRILDMVSIVQCPESEYSSRHMWLKVRINGNVSMFVGVVYMPVENTIRGVKRALLEEISEQCSRLRGKGDVFIVGDLNARVGKCDAVSGQVVGPYGEDTRNNSGELLIDFAKSEGMFLFNGRDKDKEVEFTRIGSDGSKSVLDYIIGPEKVWKEGGVKRVVVAQGVNDFIGSDHRLVYADIEVRAPVKRDGRRIRVETWKIRELREREREDKEKLLEEFAHTLDAGMSEWEHKIERGVFGSDADMMFKDWREKFEQVSMSVVGKSVKYVSPRVKRLPTAIKNLLELRNVVRKEAEESGSKELFDLAASMSDKIKALVSKRNQQKWASFCAEVKTGELSPREFYVLLKKIIGSQRSDVGGIRNSQGEIVNNAQEVREVWRDFFEVLGRDDSSGVYDDEFKVEVERRIQNLEKESFNVFEVDLDGPISSEEILCHLKQLRNFKAAGLDGIKNELLKLCASDVGVRVVSRMLNFVWEKEVLPQELTKGRIITLFKGGDPFDCGDYRGITLLSVVYKLLSAIVNTRLSVFCEKNGKLAEEQGGFRQGRGCADQLFGLFSIVADRKKRKEGTFMCFIDIKKAYDRVWRDGLWVRVADSGIKGKMWRILRMLYATTKSSVFAGGKDSEFFDTDLGVRQGDVASPLLFSIFFNGLIEILNEKGYGVKVVWRQVCGLWYADDIVLLAESAEELREMMACVDEYCHKWRCSANAKKSGVMIVGADPKTAPTFTLGGDKVPIVSKYKYLGVWFNDKWDWSDHVECVLSRTEKRVKALEWRLWRNRAVDVETKVIAWKTIFRPAVEYGSEVWWPQDKQPELFERLQLKVCKWILACAVTTTTEVVRGDLGVPSMKSRFVRARLAWAGTVRCLSEDRIVSVCGDLTSMWSRGVTRALNTIDLKEEFEELGREGDDEERSERIELWKRRVKEAVLAGEEEEWGRELLRKSKASVYREIKKSPGFEPYLRSYEFLRGGNLRFKLRSGMLHLNEEVGRWSKRFSDRYCSLCVSEEVVENSEHFLFVCPKLKEIRKGFERRLADLCRKYGIKRVINEWRKGPVSSRFTIVLGDCSEFIGEELDKPLKPGDVAREIRLISNHFISSLWSARKKLLFSDLAIPMASGANDPLCGSAS